MQPTATPAHPSGTPLSSIELDFVAGNAYRVGARPSWAWCAAVREYAAGFSGPSFASTTVYALRVLSAEAGNQGFGLLAFLVTDTSGPLN